MAELVTPKLNHETHLLLVGVLTHNYYYYSETNDYLRTNLSSVYPTSSPETTSSQPSNK
jgi:hypothetical protein